MAFEKRRVDVITMGCSKNLVDSERLMRRLEEKGYAMYHDAEGPTGEYVVLNTCGFICDALEESIQMLLSLVQRKEAGNVGKIAVMGCMSQRYLDQLKPEFPEVDYWYGKFDWDAFTAMLPDVSGEHKPVPDWDRTITTPPHSAYLKISEGCNRFCAFCAIPLITGRHTSRPVEEILDEVRELVSRGVKEFNVIAQDLSSYGMDTAGRHLLPELIERISDIEGVEWIRLHYAYPADFPYDILRVIRERKNVCKYLDIALQHISDNVLTRMRRHIGREETLSLIKRIREEVPGICLRTTLMVGFPGETEEDFEELKEFVREARFDRMGCFAYSEEQDTYAARHYTDDVPQEVKQQRREEIEEMQQRIAGQLNSQLVGRKLKVLVDEVYPDYAIARTEFDSPEVDYEVTVYGGSPVEGEFMEVEITDVEEENINAKAL